PVLAEGTSVADAARLVAEVASTGCIVLCTHGDVIWNVLVGLAHLPEAELAMEKGSTWVVDAAHGRLSAVRYLPPPAPLAG
ncbi:MAG: hypothetical protein QOE93_2560, partial [Actinomycetota bacterium]|nr:hypothetical protein [Actinomycetota bacterium]